MSGALVNRSSDLTSLSFPVLGVNFNNEVYDTDGFWDVGQPSRLTIPAGFTYAQITAGIRLPSDASTGSMFLNLYKNGVATTAGFTTIRNSTSGYANNQAVLLSPWLPVVETDYFQLRINVTGLGSPTSILSDVATFFGIRALP